MPRIKRPHVLNTLEWHLSPVPVAVAGRAIEERPSSLLTYLLGRHSLESIQGMTSMTAPIDYMPSLAKAGSAQPAAAAAAPGRPRGPPSTRYSQSGRQLLSQSISWGGQKIGKKCESIVRRPVVDEGKSGARAKNGHGS